MHSLSHKNFLYLRLSYLDIMDKIAIIISVIDPAGLNMKSQLIERYPFEKTGDLFEGKDVLSCTVGTCDVRIYTVSKESIYNEDIDKEIDADLFIFMTKHESKNNIHSLTCHAPGNWSKAQFGGKDFELCIAPALLLKECLRRQVEFAVELGIEYEITTECTHHGPFLEKPVFFIEIGSSMEQFLDKKAGLINTTVIMDLVEHVIAKPADRETYRVALGIGGLHHCHNFKKLMIEEDIAIGHVCPKYQVENLTSEMIEQAIERTDETVDLIIVDWKGLGEHKEKVREICDSINEKMGIEWVKIKDL